MFLSYLRRHYKIIIMFTLFVLIAAGVFSLYDLPAEAVAYAALLCLAVGAALFAVGYVRYLRRHRQLEALKGRDAFTPSELPEPSGALEEDYQELLRELWSARAKAEAAADTERRDAEDYYTLWAHQIKTPIAAMSLLLQSGEPKRAELQTELFRIESYVEMVLGYIRLGGNDYVLRRLLLDDAVRSCLRKYARMFITKGVSMDFSETRLTVTSDMKWLGFVIEQLLSNAVKYTPAEGRVRIYAQGRSLIIEDNGIGISAEDLPRVFEKGFTGYNGREDKKATGLGLYLCRRVCDGLGHGLSISSEAGHGVRVTISFGRDDRIME